MQDKGRNARKDTSRGHPIMQPRSARLVAPRGLRSRIYFLFLDQFLAALVKAPLWSIMGLAFLT